MWSTGSASQQWMANCTAQRTRRIARVEGCSHRHLTKIYKSHNRAGERGVDAMAVDGGDRITPHEHAAATMSPHPLRSFPKRLLQAANGISVLRRRQLT